MTAKNNIKKNLFGRKSDDVGEVMLLIQRVNIYLGIQLTTIQYHDVNRTKIMIIGWAVGFMSL